ncbi:MAG: hypothetical protein RIS75_814, partial [Actinomycetota bacterium]
MKLRCKLLRKKRGKMKKLLATFAFVLLASGCASSNVADPTRTQSSESPSSEVSETPISTDLWEGSAGQTFYFTQGDSEGEVTVKSIGRGSCRYGTAGCDPLEIGDRTVILEISVKNSGA